MNAEKKARPQRRKPPKFMFANLSRTKYPVVRSVLASQGWKFTESVTKCILFWGDCEGSLETAKRLEDWQFYNHFPGMWHIAHKVELVRNFDRMQRALPDLYNFHPKSFIIPFQMSEIRAHFATIQKRADRTFIIKPDRGAQGKGIFMIQHIEDLNNYTESAVAQEYISPLLVDGYKFDLRIYVLVTSIDPLRIYIHKEGMARFCTEKYSPPRYNNLERCYAHLTNFSLNKKSENFNEDSKRSLSSVMELIKQQNGLDPDEIMHEVDSIIRLTLISNQPHLAASYHTAISCSDGKSRMFEILGFDILLDDKGHPWLIEVNSMPSLSCGSEFDTVLKTSVISGAMKILDLTPDFKRKCAIRTRKVSTQRMSGVGKEIPQIFNPSRESEIARETNWRQIYPVDDPVIMESCALALEKSKEIPSSGINETETTRRRKEAIMAQINKTNSTSNPPSRVQTRKVSTERTSAPMSARSKPAPAKKQQVVKTQRKEPPAAVIESSRPKSAARTPRSVLLANEARATKIKAAAQRASFSNTSGILQVFENTGKNYFNDAEEKERVKTMKMRAAEASMLDMRAHIGQIVVVHTGEKKKKVVAPTLSRPANPGTKSQLLKLAIPEIGRRS